MCRCMNYEGRRPGQREGSSRYTNAMLTVIALGLGVLAMKESTGLPPAAEASAQKSARSAAAPGAAAEPGSGFPNAAEQRLRMIGQLAAIEGRLRGIESRLSSPLEVRVMEMPAVVNEPRADAVETEESP